MDASRMSTKNWVNIVLLGLGFMLLFSAFQTTAFVQVKLLLYVISIDSI